MSIFSLMLPMTIQNWCLKIDAIVWQEEMDQSEPVAKTKPAEVVETKKEEEKPVDKSKPVATKPIPGTPWWVKSCLTKPPYKLCNPQI